MLLNLFSAVCAWCREIFRFPWLVTHLRGKFHLGRAKVPLSFAFSQKKAVQLLYSLWCALGRKVNPSMSLQVNGQITQQLYDQLSTDAFETLPGQQSLQQLTDTICPQQEKQSNVVCHLSLLKATSLSHWRTSPGKPQVTAVWFFFGAVWSVHSQVTEV